MTDKIIYCANSDKYYRKTYTNMYWENADKERILEKNLAYATRKNDAERRSDLTRILNSVRRERYRGVIYSEITPDAVPEDAKIVTFNNSPNAKKHRVVSLDRNR